MVYALSARGREDVRRDEAFRKGRDKLLRPTIRLYDSDSALRRTGEPMLLESPAK